MAIRKGIYQATVVIYAASPTAAASTYVVQELEIAKGDGKRVIPFWIRGEDNKWYDSTPLGMSSTQYIDGRREKFRNGLAELLKHYFESIFSYYEL